VVIIEGHDTRIHDGHSELIEYGRSVSKCVFLSRRVQHSFDTVPGVTASDIDESDFGFGVRVGQPFGVPGDFLDPMFEEIIVVEQWPDLVDALNRDATVDENRASLFLLLIE